MGEGLEKLGLELADFTHDEYSYIFILCSHRQGAPSGRSRGDACRRNRGPLVYPQIRTFSFNPAHRQGVHFLISSAEARDISPPDRFRTAPHCNTFIRAIHSYKEVGVALKYLRHHRMMLPPCSLDETCCA